jgi:ribosome biogenesis GTPase A
MAKSMRLIEENLKVVDAVLYVLDARAAFSCLNPSFDKLLQGRNKKALYILNKCDLADPEASPLLLEHFGKMGAAILSTGTDRAMVKGVLEKLRELLTEKIEKNRKKGIMLPMRAMVIGIPNSGKSTIINTLCGNKKTLTGDRPGVTRGKQWVKISEDVELMDTPGTLWNAFDDQKAARHLAYIGSINDDVTDSEQLCACLLDELKELYPKLLKTKYGVDLFLPSHEILHQISIKKGCLKGGEADTLRGARAILDDFRKAKIGRITLERPQDA